MAAEVGEVNQAELIRLMGFSRQTAAEWSRRPGCPKRVDEHGKTWYHWHQFREWYYAEKAASKAGKPEAMQLDEARKRKLAAEAELAELELATAKAQVVSVEKFRAALTSAFGRVRAKAREAPSRLTPLLAGKSKPAQIRPVLERFFDELLGELRNQDVPEEDADEEEAAA